MMAPILALAVVAYGMLALLLASAYAFFMAAPIALFLLAVAAGVTYVFQLAEYANEDTGTWVSDWVLTLWSFIPPVLWVAAMILAFFGV